MLSDYQMQKIQERVREIKTRPSVGLFLDFDNVLADLDEFVDEETFANLRDRDIADVAYGLAVAIGRPTLMKVYYTTELEREDGVEHGAWRSRNIHETRTYPEWMTQEGMNMKMVLDAHEAVVQQKIDVVVLVTGQSTYTALAKQLINMGVVVMMVGNYEKRDRTLPRDSCVYIPMRSIMVDENNMANNVDLDDFDYSQLIRLLSISEDKMPFVGVRLFIHKVMWRLGGSQFKNPYVCQQIFQTAKERGMIEVYKQDNLEDHGKPVSACKLNREHELVMATLSDLESVTTPRSSTGLQISEEYDEEGNLLETTT